MLLSNAYDYINEMVGIIELIPAYLFLKDYITYYLNKNIESKTTIEINNQLVHLLLNLRFIEKNEIMKNYIKEPIKIIIIKIMWIESNIYYISNIIIIFELAKELFIDDGKKLYKS